MKEHTFNCSLADSKKCNLILHSAAYIIVIITFTEPNTGKKTVLFSLEDTSVIIYERESLCCTKITNKLQQC